MVKRGCFQNVEISEEDNLFASTPSLVEMRLLLCMAMARNWGITLGDVSTAFLHAAMSGEVFVWPPKDFYTDGKCLWKVKKAVCGLRQAPKLWQEHFAEVMSKLGFRRCNSDPNLYCHESGRLYVLAYVDGLLVVGTDELRKSFMPQLSEEVLLNETGHLMLGTEHNFLGRKLRHDCDSNDVHVANKAVTTAKTVPHMPLSTGEHSLSRTAVGKRLWLALIRGDIAFPIDNLHHQVMDDAGP